MSDRQLRLFPHPKPLVQRLGRDFFRQVPPKPGVYLFRNAANQVLYVGQSGNLHDRLGSYRAGNPDHLSRKIIRLIHAAAHIEWEEYASPAQARVRENELLQALRPKYNTANTYPRAYCYLGVQRAETGLEFSYTRETPEVGRWFGAFKTSCLTALASMLRLLWSSIQPHEFPRRLIGPKPPREFLLPLQWNNTKMEEAVCRYLAGVSDELVTYFQQKLPAPESLPLFFGNLQRADMEVVENFFRTGPQTNYKLRQHHQLSEPLILQEELDDFLVLWREKRSSTDLPSAPSA